MSRAVTLNRAGLSGFPPQEIHAPVEQVGRGARHFAPSDKVHLGPVLMDWTLRNPTTSSRLRCYGGGDWMLGSDPL